MLKRYLPSDRRGADGLEMGWTSSRYDDARSLIFRLRETHDRDLPHWRPHAELIDFCGARLEEPDLVASLQKGWTLARGEIAAGMATPITPITPVTRIAAFGRAASVTPLTHIASPEPIVLPRLVEPSAARGEIAAMGAHVLRKKPRAVRDETSTIGPHLLRRPEVQAPWRAKLLLLSLVAGVAASAPPFIGNPEAPLFERASPESGERNAISPVQVPRSSFSVNGAAAPPAAEAEPANSAGDANDRLARSQRDQVADAPEPAASIDASGGLATDEPPASAAPREQAIVANPAPAPVSTPADKVSSSSDATTREQAAPRAAKHA